MSYACKDADGFDDLEAKLSQWSKTGPNPPFLKPEVDEPDEEELERFALDGVCDTTDGCTVEPDGYCEHGHVSWLLYLGLM